VHRRTRDSETPFEFTQKIENGLSAILGFFADVVRVIYRMFRHPLSFDRYADPKGNLAPSVRPFTFLALTAFIATNAVRALTTSMLLVLLTFARCSAPETQEEVALPNMASLLKLPAVEDVLLTALPAVLLSVLFLTLFLRAFRGQAAAGRGRALNLCLYIVGLQYLLLAFSVSWFISGNLFNKADEDGTVSPLMSISSDVIMISYVAAASLLILGWPALLASTQIAKLLPASGGRAHARVARVVGVTLAALFLSLGTLPLGLLISIPLSASTWRVRPRRIRPWRSPGSTCRRASNRRCFACWSRTARTGRSDFPRASSSTRIWPPPVAKSIRGPSFAGRAATTTC
jgi:hypothetical protein